jgi:pullulanase/glycogen debranching enzyme
MRHPGIPPELRGTYAGLGHDAALAHLVGLGVTAVELLPVHQHVPEAMVVERGLTNYWGYNTIGFFAPTLARQDGGFDRLSAFFDLIHQDPVVSRAKLIAEPWDVGQPDSYDVGRFPPGWSEWNGRYRDTMRDFWSGRHRRQPVLELRDGGSERRPRGAPAPRPAVSGTARHAAAVVRDSDAARRGRARPQPGWQQQRLLPGQSGYLVRLVAA